MRSKIFANRNIKEISKDPLSYIFCLGFPVIMLIIMTIVNSSIPPEAEMTAFQIKNLAPGIIVFAFTFTMLFTVLSVSKDRASAFLIRLYASPMKSSDFILGYTIPMIYIASMQTVITYVLAIIIGACTDYTFNLCGVLLSIPVLIPSMILFIGFGLIFGTLFTEKSGPGLCSIIIALVGIIGGIWMDVESIGGTIEKICKLFPFFHGVKAARMAVAGEYSKIWPSLLIVLIWAVVIYALAILVFKKKMQSEIK
jgi:ABC-2 type transport system permease protein